MHSTRNSFHYSDTTICYLSLAVPLPDTCVQKTHSQDNHQFLVNVSMLETTLLRITVSRQTKALKQREKNLTSNCVGNYSFVPTNL